MTFGDRPALLFDLDGTLVDSGDDLAAAVNHVLGQDGLLAVSREQVLRMLGDGASVLVERAYAHHGAKRPHDALARFRGHYRSHCLDATRPYPGVSELLRRLAPQRAVAVATNKPIANARQIVEGLGLESVVDTVVGPESSASPKPSPGMLLAALEALGHEPGEAVMIGDSPSDVVAGRRAGTATIAVLWGYRTQDQLAASGPDRIAATVEELAGLLLSGEGARSEGDEGGDIRQLRTRPDSGAQDVDVQPTTKVPGSKIPAGSHRALSRRMTSRASGS